MDEPPRRLSNNPNEPDFHPSYLRVGVRVDGAECRDCSWYDADRCLYRTTSMGRADVPKIATVIEPYFRHPENRQQRRARERWESKHG